MPTTAELTDRELYENKRYDRYLVEKDNFNIIKQDDYCIVSNNKNSSMYRITKGEHGHPECECADFQNRGLMYVETEEDRRPGYCKHIHAVVEWSKQNRGLNGNGNGNAEKAIDKLDKNMKEEKVIMSKQLITDEEILNILGDKSIKTKQRQGPGSKILNYVDVPEMKRLMDTAFSLNYNFEILSINAFTGVWCVHGRITATLPDGRVIFRDGLGTEIIDKPGMTPDLTLKSAVSESYKLCGKYWGCGLFLYDKDFYDENSGGNGKGNNKLQNATPASFQPPPVKSSYNNIPETNKNNGKKYSGNNGNGNGSGDVERYISRW